MELFIENINVELVNYPYEKKDNAANYIKNWVQNNLIVELERLGIKQTNFNSLLNEITLIFTFDSMGELETRKNEISQQIINKIISLSKGNPAEITKFTTAQSAVSNWKNYLLNGWVEDSSFFNQYEPNLELLKELVEDSRWSEIVYYRAREFYTFYQILRFFVDLKKIQQNPSSKIPSQVWQDVQDRNPQTKYKVWSNDMNKTTEYDILMELLKLNEKSLDLCPEKKDVTKTQVETGNKTTEQITSFSKIALPHAGLFMIHPYFTRVLEQTGLLSQKEVINKVKACQVLHYLASGNEHPKEYELLTEKTILNIELESYLAINEDLDPKTKQVIDDILLEIINEWSGIQNSGIEFLRTMFLSRKGTLKNNSKSIEICIPKQAQDILLKDMSWGLGIIKLPWHPKLIDIKIS